MSFLSFLGGAANDAIKGLNSATQTAQRSGSSFLNFLDDERRRREEEARKKANDVAKNAVGKTGQFLNDLPATVADQALHGGGIELAIPGMTAARKDMEKKKWDKQQQEGGLSATEADIEKDAPKAVADFGLSFLRSFPQGAVRAYNTLAPGFSGKTASDQQEQMLRQGNTSVKPNEGKTFEPKNSIEKAILGDQPVGDFSSLGKDYGKMVGLNDLPAPIAFGLGAASTAADFFTGGKSKEGKALVETLSKTDDAAKAFKTLRSSKLFNDVDPKILEQAGTDLAKVTDTGKIQKILGQVLDTSKGNVDNAVSSASKMADSALPNIDELAQTKKLKEGQQVLDQMAKDRADMLQGLHNETKNTIFQDIKGLGGIKSHGGGQLAEETNAIPTGLRNNKTGMTADEMVSELQGMGHNVADESDLLNQLSSYKAQSKNKKSFLDEAHRQLMTGTDEESKLYQATHQMMNEPVVKPPETQLMNIEQPGAREAIPLNQQPTKPLREFEQAMPQTTNDILSPAQAKREFAKRTDKTQFNVPGTEVNAEIPFVKKQRESTRAINLASDLEGTRNVETKTTAAGNIVPVSKVKGTMVSEKVGDTTQIKNVGSSMQEEIRIIQKATKPGTLEREAAMKGLVEPIEQAKGVANNVNKDLGSKIKDITHTLGMKETEWGGGKRNKAALAMRDFGEGKISKEKLVENFGMEKADAIEQASFKARALYDEMFSLQNSQVLEIKAPQRGQEPIVDAMREALAKNDGAKAQELLNGLEDGPLKRDIMHKWTPYRKDYFTHMDERNGLLADLVNKENAYGVTETKNVGMRARFSKERKGDKVSNNPIKAMQDYAKIAAHNHAYTIPLEKRKLYRDALEAKSVADENKGNLQNFINQIDEQNRSIAGDPVWYDKQIGSSELGKKALNLLGKLQSKIGKNTIVGSVPSTIMQTLGIAQAPQEFGFKTTMLGMLDNFTALMSKGDDIIDKSPVYTERYADNHAVRSITEKGMEIVSKPFDLVEKATSRMAWRTAYRDAIKNGYKGEEAITMADRGFKKIVGGRGIGDKATAFNSKSGNTAMQFQLEVNNIYQNIKQDLGIGGYSKIQPKKLMEMAITFYVMNNMLDTVMGKRPLPDPIDATIDVSKDIAKGDYKAVIGRYFGEILSNMPGGQTIASFAPENVRKDYFGETDVGRYGGSIPVVNALQGTAGAMLNGNFGKAISTGISNFVTPFGGNPVKRSLAGVVDFNRGYTETDQGQVKFRIDQNPINFIKTTLLGSYSTPEGSKYIKDQLKPLSDARSQKVKDVIEEQKSNPDKEQGAQIVNSTIQFYQTLQKAPDKDPYTEKINKAIVAGDINEAKSIADEYNSKVNEVFNDYKSKYGQYATKDIIDEYDKYLINLTSKSINARRKSEQKKVTK